MPEDTVVRIKNELYQQAKDLAEAEGISMADAVSRLVENGGAQPNSCELVQFRKVMESQGLTLPKRADWVWGVTDILPVEMLAGTKLEPYAQAKSEAELRCCLSDELYDKLIGKYGTVNAVEKAVEEAVAEATEHPETADETIKALGLESNESPSEEQAEPVGEPDSVISTSLKAEVGGDSLAESTPPAEVLEPAEATEREE